jgi:hypothetical protein
MKYSNLSERQILKAQAEGQLDNLEGAGKPLPAEGFSGGADAIGYRIMAEAGALPREIELRKAIEVETKALREAPDEAGRKKAMAKLADLQMRLSIEQEARRKFLKR